MQNNASITSFRTLAARAIYLVAPKNKQVLNDPYAEFLLPRSFLHLRLTLKFFRRIPGIFSIIKLFSRFYSPVDIASIGMRHRFIDECLEQAIADGFQQVVLLGAGFDSRAHRFNHPQLRFIEIDHPQTQGVKQRQLNKIKLPLNKMVHYISVDFMRDWKKQVIETGLIEKNLKTLFIWEGVIYYLNDTAISYTLETLHELVDNDFKLVLDSLPAEVVQPQSAMMQQVKKQLAALGEPLLWGCDQEHFCKLLSQHGYHTNKKTGLTHYRKQLLKKHQIDVPEHLWHEFSYLVEASYKAR